MTLNRELLQKVRDHFASVPDREANMGQWASVQGIDGAHIYGTGVLELRGADFSSQKTPCGTVCCIAGATWLIGTVGKADNLDQADLRALVTAAGDKEDYSQIGEEAAVLLGLPVSAKDALFYTHRWPQEFRDMIRGRRSGHRQAMIALLDAMLSGRATLDEDGWW